MPRFLNGARKYHDCRGGCASRYTHLNHSRHSRIYHRGSVVRRMVEECELEIGNLDVFRLVGGCAGHNNCELLHDGEYAECAALGEVAGWNGDRV